MIFDPKFGRRKSRTRQKHVIFTFRSGLMLGGIFQGNRISQKLRAPEFRAIKGELAYIRYSNEDS